MSIWKSLFGQAAQHAGRKALEKAQEPETQEKARAAARQASEAAKRGYDDIRGAGNPGRAAGQAVGSVFVRLKKGVDKGFDAPPRDWGGGDGEDSEKK